MNPLLLVYWVKAVFIITVTDYHLEGTNEYSTLLQ